MKKIILSLFFFLLLLFLFWAIFLGMTFPETKERIEGLVEKTEKAYLDPLRWYEIRHEARKLPPVYPINLLRNSFERAAQIVFEIDEIRRYDHLLKSQILTPEQIDVYFDSAKDIYRSLRKIEDSLEDFPDFFLPEGQKEQKKQVLEKVKQARSFMGDLMIVHKIFQKMARQEERVLLLFQNPNEPRSTGGFTGSLVLIDFSPEEIRWSFEDVYAFDRLVPEYAQLPAPDFFHPLSRTISLRDANFFPDFETSAKAYQHFFESIDGKVPHTVIAINSSVMREILKMVGPVKLDRWDIWVNSENVDLVLEFLLGSQIEGRFGVKRPILELGEKVFSVSKIQNISSEKLSDFDFQTFLKQKNILAYSREETLQKIFQKWKIDARVRPLEEGDNFLYFDFISVGANKSEKFMWTRLDHTSKIYANGKVENVLEIRRTHAIKPGEIEALLGYSSWTPNIKALLTPELRWVLGEGQNRTYLRILVPKKTTLTFQDNPSGPVIQNFTHDGLFRVFEVPMFVDRGESLDIRLEYVNQITRGNYDYRPYHLQVIGTPARDKTTFTSVIETASGGSFSARTLNLGFPQPLMDQSYRAIIEY